MFNDFLIKIRKKILKYEKNKRLNKLATRTI